MVEIDSAVWNALMKNQIQLLQDIGDVVNKMVTKQRQGDIMWNNISILIQRFFSEIEIAHPGLVMELYEEKEYDRQFKHANDSYLESRGDLWDAFRELGAVCERYGLIQEALLRAAADELEREIAEKEKEQTDGQAT